jgi:hypothetical protein
MTSNTLADLGKLMEAVTSGSTDGVTMIDGTSIHVSLA